MQHSNMYLTFLYHIGIPIMLFLLGWIMKQNRDAKVRMEEAIKMLTDAVTSVEQELQTYREGWIDRREVLLGIVAQHCSDAQTACRGNFNLRLDGLKEGQENVCVKIDELKLARNQKWEQQESLNRTVLAHVNDTKLHNKTEKG